MSLIIRLFGMYCISKNRAKMPPCYGTYIAGAIIMPALNLLLV